MPKRADGPDLDGKQRKQENPKKLTSGDRHQGQDQLRRLNYGRGCHGSNNDWHTKSIRLGC